MLQARIIPCLDVRHGRTVKGVGFQNMMDAGDPVELALRYAADGADELVWLDIAATVEAHAVSLNQIKRLRRNLNIPLTVGGGIKSIEDVWQLLDAGADKVSMNSYALSNPGLIAEVACRWGSQCAVVAVDAKRVDGDFLIFSHGGRQSTGRELGAWLSEAEGCGAGEFLLTSIDRDGTQLGYDGEMMDYARACTRRPIIASGGAGTSDHLAAMLQRGHLAVLLASILHQGQCTVSAIKRELCQRGLPIRVSFPCS